MGYNLNLFEDKVDDELICPICMDVFEDPVQDDNDHTFCKMCIYKWLETNRKCPLDRKTLCCANLKQPPRLVKNLLSKLHMKCSFESCPDVLTLDNYNRHLAICSFDPKKSVICQRECHLPITPSFYEQHSCIEELNRALKIKKELVQQYEESTNKLKAELAQMSIKYQKLEILNRIQADQIKELKNGSFKKECAIVSIRKRPKWNSSTLLTNEN